MYSYRCWNRVIGKFGQLAYHLFLCRGRFGGGSATAALSLCHWTFTPSCRLRAQTCSGARYLHLRGR